MLSAFHLMLLLLQNSISVTLHRSKFLMTNFSFCLTGIHFDLGDHWFKFLERTLSFHQLFQQLRWSLRAVLLFCSRQQTPQALMSLAGRPLCGSRTSSGLWLDAFLYKSHGNQAQLWDNPKYSHFHRSRKEISQSSQCSQRLQSLTHLPRGL